MRQGGLYGNGQQGNPRYLIVVAVLVVLGIVYWSTLGVEHAEKHRLPQLIDEDNCVLSPPTKKKVCTLILFLLLGGHHLAPSLTP